MTTKNQTNRRLNRLFLLVSFLLLPGCVATQGWVSKQLQTMNTRMTDMEQQIAKTDSRFAATDPRIASAVSQQVAPLGNRVETIEQRVAGVENRLATTEGNLSQVNAKTEKTLGELKDLRLTRRLVLDLKSGAYFKPSSAVLMEPAKRNIDNFLTSLKPKLKDNHVFYVAGYTDNLGSSKYNYELGRKRADSVARYLVLEKAIDPTRVITVSGGDAHPAANNATLQGREKNRRVEIFVYKDEVTRVQAEIAATLSRMALTPEVAPGN